MATGRGGSRPRPCARQSLSRSSTSWVTPARPAEPAAVIRRSLGEAGSRDAAPRAGGRSAAWAVASARTARGQMQSGDPGSVVRERPQEQAASPAASAKPDAAAQPRTAVRASGPPASPVATHDLHCRLARTSLCRERCLPIRSPRTGPFAPAPTIEHCHRGARRTRKVPRTQASRRSDQDRVFSIASAA
jgi:hypothetical protein